MSSVLDYEKRSAALKPKEGHESWYLRQAAQIVAQLPDDYKAALCILAWAAAMVNLARSGGVITPV